jgi:hypothetical protein
LLAGLVRHHLMMVYLVLMPRSAERRTIICQQTDTCIHHTAHNPIVPPPPEEPTLFIFACKDGGMRVCICALPPPPGIPARMPIGPPALMLPGRTGGLPVAPPAAKPVGGRPAIGPPGTRAPTNANWGRSFATPGIAAAAAVFGATGAAATGRVGVLGPAGLAATGDGVSDNLRLSSPGGEGDLERPAVGSDIMGGGS